MKRILLLLALLPVLLFLTGCSSSLPALTVTFFQVGKGDCILLECDGHAAMIDTGFEDTAEEVLSALSDKGISSLDFLLLTHPDKDHIGGAEAVLEKMDVQCVYAPDYEKDSKAFRRLEKALKKAGLEAVHPAQSLTLSFGGASFTLLPPEKESYDQSNDSSILSLLTYGKTRFLFAGDAESERLGEVLEDTDLRADVLKVPHHGRWDDLSEEFFRAVSPRYAVICCDADNMPDDEVLQALQSLGTEVHGTVYGDVVFVSDGQSVSPQS